MQESRELAGRTPGKVGKVSRWESLGNALRRVLFWRASNAFLDFAEGDITPDGEGFAVIFHRFDGKKLSVTMTVAQLDDLSDVFARAAIGLAHAQQKPKPQPALPEGENIDL